MSYKIPPGVFDIVPLDENEPWRSSYLWNYVEEVIRKTAYEFGYQEIRTPVFERTELFTRGIGESTDIVSKEMYTFEDRGGRSMTLRPEGTAPAMRAFIENHLNSQGPVHKLFYICPMFRYERSQAGRYRQHHQFGVEAIGSSASEQDVEAIDLIYTVYKKLGIKDLKVYINSIGNTNDRAKFKEALHSYLSLHYDRLSEDSKVRLEKNPLRILDSKSPEDQLIVANAPSILDFLCEESLAHFKKVQTLLAAIEIPYEINPCLVRGLDYYNQTVFEIVSGVLGSQNSLVGGGRYDGLLKQLGGPDLPAIGFGSGIERIIQTMINQMVPLPKPNCPTLFMIALGEKARSVCFKILHTLRQNGIAVQLDFSERKLNKVMQYADQIRAQYVAVVGDDELEKGIVELKNMSTGKMTKAPLYNMTHILDLEQKYDLYTKIWTELSKPLEDPLEKDYFLNKLNTSIHETENIVKDLQDAMESIKKLDGKE